MRTITAVMLVAALALSARALSTQEPAARPAATAPGLVVAVGGGGTPPEVLQHVAKLAGGAKARVLVMPQASAVSDGLGSAEMWREAGAGEATVLEDLAAADAAERIRAANVIWIPGGSQSRFMERLDEHGLADAIRAAHAAGAIVGGTSAGAAVQSAVMIAGAPEPGILRGGAMEALVGLGLWPGVIVDQHFVERDRLGRLLTAVLDHPELVGVGVSERTAALVDGHRLEVMGSGHVIVYDARAAAVTRVEKGAHQSARDVRLHVLRPGDVLDTRAPSAPEPK